MTAKRRAILSVSDKTGLAAFAQGLADLGFELVSTGGTAAALRAAGLAVTDVSAVTGFPEMLDGRVKTLHPKVHGGLLGLRDVPAHAETMREHGIEPFDLICVNLYPFEATVAKGAPDHEVIEQIDIGGPAMVRSASKNHRFVVVVTSPSQYDEVLAHLRSAAGDVPQAARRALARAAYLHTSRYDAAIADYLDADANEPFPALFAPLFDKVRGLRYGENPHQRAAVYAERGASGPSVAKGTVLSGKELSHNNILDLDAALRIVREFEAPACVAVKHANPCGCAVAGSQLEAWERALAGDPVSAFGGILGFNRPVDAATAESIARPDRFVECIVAPSFHAEAAQILTTRTKWGKNVRLVEVGDVRAPLAARERSVRRVLGGLLVQDHDRSGDAELRVVTKRAPTEDELRDLRFAWLVCKHVSSNAILLAKGGMQIGAGAGQTSRVDSSWMAVRKAGDRAAGSVAASDAFFPFADALTALLDAGVTAVVQPGGSVRDPEVIAAADAAGAAMVFTGVRHFRH